MKCKTLAPLLLALLALPAAAQDLGSVFGQALPYVAQMSQEERRAMRERWEQASPEERARLRRSFQERLRTMPGEQFAPGAMEMGNRMGNQMGNRLGETWQEFGFGTGYEQRHYEDDPYGSDRGGGYGNDRRGRGRR